MDLLHTTYNKRFFFANIIGFCFGFPVVAGYVLILLNIKLDDIIKMIFFSTSVAISIELLLSQTMSYYISKKNKNMIKEWETGLLKDRAQVTALFLRLNQIAIFQAIAHFSRIMMGSLISIVYMYIIGITIQSCLMAVVLSAYGSLLAGVLVYGAITNLHRPTLQNIIASGFLDDETIKVKKHFSLSLKTKNILLLFVPVVVTNLSVVFCAYTAWAANATHQETVLRLIGNITVSIATMIAFMSFSVSMIKRPLDSLEKSLAVFSSGNGNFSERLSSDLSDEFAYIAYLMNKAISNFQDIISKIHSASGNLNNSIQDLNVSTQEISATSNQQAAGVKEIIATMEDSDQLSKKVSSQAIEVAKIAESTKDVVRTGFTIIKDSLEKMDSIKDANSLSIRGIKDLGDKISKIWDIVNIINSIADQTKIIAFNAELEAASAGDAGKSFQIVATEIRRLADSTVSSTTEIKNRINEMQKSSDHLILSSEEGTTKIIAGWELSNKLQALFEDIMSTSEISSDSANQIANSISQQVLAFDQILLTLKQISSGIDNFVSSTSSTSKLTKVLMDMSVDLHQIAKKYDEQNAN